MPSKLPMKPIRILVDSFADEDAMNSQMTNARDIMSRLNCERFHVTTFVTGKPDPRIENRPATRLIRLPRKRQTPRILKQFVLGSHDILFYLKASPASRMYMSPLRKWFDKRLVIGTMESQSDMRNEPTVKPSQIRIWEQTILRSDFLFSNSHSVQASLEKEYGFPSEVIPTGVDTKFFTPAWDRPPGSRLQVLFVGALRPFKGPLLLLRAAAQHPSVDFTVVGEGILAGELEEQVRVQGLANVRFARGLNHTKLREHYRQADIFFFPSRWEGSPKVIMEAAACGLPVIARGDYQPETVAHGVTGLLGASDDELLRFLSQLTEREDLRTKFGRAGRAHMKSFDWDRIVLMWEEVFEKLLSRRSRRQV